MGGKGAEYNIMSLLTQLISKHPPSDPTKVDIAKIITLINLFLQAIRIKFAFDGANVTNGSRKQQEIGTLEILTDKTINEVKSYKNCHQWLIYLGAEDTEELRAELERSIPVITHLNKTKKVS